MHTIIASPRDRRGARVRVDCLLDGLIYGPSVPELLNDCVPDRVDGGQSPAHPINSASYHALCCWLSLLGAPDSGSPNTSDKDRRTRVHSAPVTPSIVMWYACLRSSPTNCLKSLSLENLEMRLESARSCCYAYTTRGKTWDWCQNQTRRYIY